MLANKNYLVIFLVLFLLLCFLLEEQTDDEFSGDGALNEK